MCEGVFPFPPMLSASSHWGRLDWFLTQKLKPLLPDKRAEFCLCMGQAHTLGKTEPFLNLRRQNLTGLLWLFYLFCISWLRNKLLIDFLRLESISAGAGEERIGDGRVREGDHPSKKWIFSQKKAQRPQKGNVFPLALFIYVLIFTCTWLRIHCIELWQPLCNHERTNHLRIKLTWRHLLIHWINQPQDILTSEFLLD